MRVGTTQVCVCSKNNSVEDISELSCLHLISGVGNDSSSSGEQDSEENTKPKNEFSTRYNYRPGPPNDGS